jgi:hypothetical protein
MHMHKEAFHYRKNLVRWNIFIIRIPCTCGFLLEDCAFRRIASTVHLEVFAKRRSIRYRPPRAIFRVLRNGDLSYCDKSNRRVGSPLKPRPMRLVDTCETHCDF